MAKILITGAAGFIGFHLAKRLLEEQNEVIGIDNLNEYYDVKLKEDRLKLLQNFEKFEFCQLDLIEREKIIEFIIEKSPKTIVHLAAQAGVRYSLQNPFAYVDSNMVGFINVIEGARQSKINHLVFASSSSVYGANTQIPFSVNDNVDHPISLYAASKKCNELVAHTYSHLYQIPTTGLRFFTVYGPWGRPDMALFLFTKAILAGKPIKVFNHGDMKRDFTYVDDIIEGVIRVMNHIPKPDPNWSGNTPNPSSSKAPYRIYNIGNHTPVPLLDFISILEKCLERKAKKEFLPIQPGDVEVTFANVNNLQRDVGFSPNTPIELGVQKFVAWYKAYYKIT